MCRKLLIGLAVTLMLNACASAPQSAALRQQTPESLFAPVLLSQVPFFAQELYQCGPAALATMLVTTGIEVTPEQLVPLVYVPEREGSFQIEMVATTRSHGRLAYKITPNLETLLSEVAAGHPVLVLQNLSLQWYPKWHFAVVKGFDLSRRKLILNSGLVENYEVSIATFERTWARADYWGVLALEPGVMPAVAEPTAYFSALAAMEITNPSTVISQGYASGLETWPTDRNLLMGYGNLLYTNKSPAAAAEQYSKVIAHHPEYAPAHNNLANILFEMGQHEAALVHARHAVLLGGDYIENYRTTLRMINPAAL
ncbi:MAG: PA2778 family cysteine peptidase [Gammaproteobacteria bacterium]|nr:PA2778 family cysteine peptidase [Gammaproteobacteria bacterium]MDP2347963.1 PA2778 family cysteine peptidase [Gammaproteobacteria bacterium]